MMNNNTQVSLRNGANFSHIRRAQKGTKIPSLSIGGITHQSGDWYNTIFSSFREQMMADLAAAKTPEEKQAVIEKYNSQQAAYGKLRPQFTNLSAVDFNQKVKDYQDLINSDFNFVNTYGIKNGVTTNRYKKIGTANRVGKDLADKWLSDGYWAGQTQDRTTLGYKGDWDEESDTFKNWQKSLNDLGMETYLDTDNTYKLRLLQEDNTLVPPPEKDQSTPPGPPEKEPPVTTPPYTWDPVEYEGNPSEPTKLGKWRFPTFPLYNGALHGIASLTNKRALDTMLKAPTLRLEAPTAYGKVTDAYAERTGNQQAFQKYKWGVQQQLDNTNDLGRAQEAYRDVLGKEFDMQMQNNKAKQDEYNQTSQNLQSISNTNKQNWNAVANQNRQNYVADAKDRLNKIAQYQLQQGQLAQENVMANYTDWKSWNRNNMLQDYADWQANEGAKVQQDLQAAWDEYQNSGDITKWEGYGNLWSNNMLQNGEPDPTTELGKEYANWLRNKPGAQASDPALQKQFLEEHEGQSFKGELDAFWKNWADYKSNAMQNYIKNRDAITTDYGLLKARYNPIQFNGEVSPWLWRAMNGGAPSYQRQYMKRGGRFLEYLEHNRKAEKDIRDVTMKSMSESRRMLRRELDALDRESLLLLRSIFK